MNKEDLQKRIDELKQRKERILQEANYQAGVIDGQIKIILELLADNDEEG